MRRASLALPLLLGLAACGGANGPLATALYQGVGAGPPQARGTAAPRGPSRPCDTAARDLYHAGMTVEQLFFSHSPAGDWGAGQLGRSVLPPGRGGSCHAALSGAYDSG